MPVCYYEMPEDVWGYDAVTRAYHEKPEKSLEKIIGKIRENFHYGSDADLMKLVRK